MTVRSGLNLFATSFFVRLVSVHFFDIVIDLSYSKSDKDEPHLSSSS